MDTLQVKQPTFSTKPLQPQSIPLSNNIVETTPPPSNSFFWIFIGLLFLIVFIAIVFHLFWNPFASKTTTTNNTVNTVTSDTYSPNTVIPSSSDNIETPMNLSSPYELTNNNMSYNNDDNMEMTNNNGGSGFSSQTNQGTSSSSSFNPYSDSSLDTALNNATKTQTQSQTQNEGPQPDIASSSYSNNNTGWCYIGEEKGYRSCSKVGQNDECMSGEIFPTRDICINPSLRA